MKSGGQNGAVPQKRCSSCTSQLAERNTFSTLLAGKDSVLTRLAGRKNISTCLAGENSIFACLAAGYKTRRNFYEFVFKCYDQHKISNSKAPVAKL